MKNSFYTLLIFGFVISSCGTSKQYTSSEYGDAIYNNSPEKIIALSTATDEGLANLKQKTKELGRTTVNGYDAKVIYVNDEGAADIVVDGEGSYLILDSTMSFEERLTKFRSPNYNINIYISDRWGWNDNDYYSPWWYMSSNPWYFRNRMDRYYGSSFYYDWWGSPFSRWGSRYYDPWNYGYYGYNSWYGYYGYPFSRYYNNYGYYGSYYGWYGWPYGSYHYGDKYGDWYGGGGHSGGYTSDRGRYIGKRVDNYRSAGDNNNGPSRGVVKREPRMEQIGGTRVDNTPNREGSVYRRENKTGTSGVIHNTEVVNPNRSSGQTERTGTGYRRPSSEARVNSTGNQENRSYNNATRTESTYRRSSVSVDSYREGNSQSGSSVRNTNSSSRGSSSSYERSSSSYDRNSNSAGSSSVRSSNTGSSGSTSSSSSSSSSGSGSTYRR